ncbi:MAG: hypothetical protein AMXMBFR56_66110 [Polyangiaceae bacterium]
MGEPRCKTCKHWANEPGLWVSECRRIDDQMSGDPKDPRFAELETDDYAKLKTGPEFGCVLWEGLPAPEEKPPGMIPLAGAPRGLTECHVPVLPLPPGARHRAQPLRARRPRPADGDAGRQGLHLCGRDPGGL